MTVQSEAMLTAKYRLIDEIRRIARKAAEFECSANNYDRSRSEAPEHIGARYYGDGEHDARWYAVHGALTGFNERIATDIADALATYTAVVLIEASPTEGAHDA